jgi:hypothetical protein
MWNASNVKLPCRCYHSPPHGTPAITGLLNHVDAWSGGPRASLTARLELHSMVVEPSWCIQILDSWSYTGKDMVRSTDKSHVNVATPLHLGSGDMMDWQDVCVLQLSPPIAD